MDEKAVDQYLLEEHIYRLFCEQLQKDFEGAGLAMSFPPEIHDPARLRSAILQSVIGFSRGQGEGLRRLLYRVDISEKQLGAFHRRHSATSFEEVVAELIIRRVLQKVILRKRFSNG